MNYLKGRSRPQLIVNILLIIGLSIGCSPNPVDTSRVDYTPSTDHGWQISTPEEQGLDPKLVEQLYAKSAQLKTTYGLLVIKNGFLIAEDYFHIGHANKQVNIHSVTKSINSALVGIALEKGCITSLDQKMMDFFPELVDQVKDKRKFQITIRQMLQMRAGYKWEESTPELLDLLFSGFHTSDIINVPLAYHPGWFFKYSNLTSHILGIIVARSCGTDLNSFARENLFSPLSIEPGFWQTDWDGNYLGFSDIHLTVHDLAKIGLLYLNDGVFEGVQVVPKFWVQDSLKDYTRHAWKQYVGPNWRNNGYGYQWWSVRAGHYRYNLAWGHGGEQIVIIKDMNMVIVLQVDPLHLQHGDKYWKIEKENLNLIADFVASLPRE